MINIFLTFCSRSGDNIETYVYRKSANIDIYVHWNLIAPTTWKRSTLDKLVLRAYIIWSNEKLIALELKYYRNFFLYLNGSPHWYIIEGQQCTK